MATMAGITGTPMDKLQGPNVSVLTVPPNDLRSLNTVKQTLYTGRNPYVIQPYENKTYTKTQRRLRIDLPTVGIYDFTTGYLKFWAQTNVVAGPAWTCFMNLISTCIYRITLFQGTRNVAEITDYGMKAAIKWEHTQDVTYSVNHQDEIGVGTLVNRQAWKVGRWYVVPIDFGPLRRPLNLGDLKGPCYIEIEFYDPLYCIEADNVATPVDYLIKNVSLTVDELPSIPPLYLAANKGLSGGQWAELECDIYEVANNAVQTTDVEIPFTGSSIQHIALAQMPDSQKSNVSVLNRFVTHNYNSTQRIRYKVNSAPFPHDMIDCTNADFNSDVWLHYKKALHIQRLDMDMYNTQLSINRAQFFGGDRFFLIVSMEQNHQPGDLNPVGVSGKGGLFAHIEWPAPTTTRLYFLVYHWVVYEMDSAGNILCGR